MRKRDLRKWLWTAPLLLAGGAAAQEAPKSPTAPTNGEAPVETGGKVSFETIPMGDGRPTASLRYGSVKKGSEIVDLDGRRLTRDKDYVFDYGAGTIYLMVGVRTGSSLKVSYRYEESTGKAGTFGVGTGSNAFSGYTYNLVRGTSAVVGLGFTERLGDGTVVNSNNYGLTNNFSFGGGGVLSGLFMMSDRTKSNAVSMMGEANGTAEADEGQGRALIQNMAMPFAGGSMNFYYQDIDKRFAGFQSFGSAGYTAEQVAQLQKEKGLQRTMFSFKDVGAGDLKVSYSEGKVGDEAGQIVQKSQALKLGSFSLNHRTQKVDQEFNRFSDVGAADWQWLQKEKGLTRDNWSGALQFGSGALAYNSFETGDDANSVSRRAIVLSSKIFNVDYYEQKIDTDFNRFGDLRPEDWSGEPMLSPQFQNFANERGLSRTGLGVSAQFIPGAELSYRQNRIEDDAGDIEVVNAILKRGGLTLQHARIDISKEFSRLGSLGSDLPSYADQSVKMMNPGLGLKGNDVQAFAGTAGLERDMWRLGYDFGKGAKFGYQVNSITGAEDELRSSKFDFSSANINFNYSDQKTGAAFNEIGSLMQSEREVYGTTPGLDKTDMSLAVKLNKDRTVEASSMNADDPTGGVMRQVFAFNDKSLNFRYTRRNVDADFGGVSALVDPERDLLRALVGQDMTEMNLRWQMLPNLGIQSQRMSLENVSKGETGAFEDSKANWSPFKGTKLEYFRWGQSRYNETDALVDQLQERLLLTQNLGRLGTLTLMQQNLTYGGTEDTALDAKTQSVVYDNQFSKSTGFRTEHSETKFETGEKETTTANTLSTDLSSRAGVSVTDIKVKREGDKPDESRQQYGFWYDFGKGIKIKYGYNRGLKDDANGTLNRTAEVSGGEFQGVKIDGASYKEDRVDDVRDQHLGGISILNAKPLDWGFIKDVRFNYSSNTQRDYNLWKKEDKRFGFGASSGNIAYGYDYYSQVGINEERAIDRFFTLNLDKSGKAPLQVGLRYGVRTLPNDENTMIRDYAITYKPNDAVSFEHSVKTNLLKDQNNALLGSVTTPDRTNLWALNYTANPNFTAGLYWKEAINEQANLRRREGGIDLLLFRNNPSPLRLQYGLEQTDAQGQRTTAHRWGITFNQRPGPNQSFNFMFENRAWEHNRAPDFDLQKWNMRLDYTVRF